MPSHVTALVANAGYIVDRAIRIKGRIYLTFFVTILKYDLVVALQPRQCFRIGKIPAFAMGYRDFERFVGYFFPDQVLFTCFADVYIFAHEFLVIVL